METKVETKCEHVCTSNCRRVGCNCECGEFHGDEPQQAMNEQQEKERKIRVYQARRNELVEAIGELDSNVSMVEIYELQGEVSEIDAKIHAIDPSKV